MSSSWRFWRQTSFHWYRLVLKNWVSMNIIFKNPKNPKMIRELNQMTETSLVKNFKYLSYVQNITSTDCWWFTCNNLLNKAICEHSPRLRDIQGYKRLRKATQGNTRQFLYATNNLTILQTTFFCGKIYPFITKIQGYLRLLF